MQRIRQQQQKQLEDFAKILQNFSRLFTNKNSQG